MSNCDKYLEQASLYVDGELPEDELPGLLAHLKGCAECRRYYEAMKAVSGEIGETPAPEGFAASVMSGIRASAGEVSRAAEKPAESRRPKLRRAAVVRSAALAACLALVIAAGVKVSGPEDRNGSVPEAKAPAMFEAAAGENSLDDVPGVMPADAATPTGSSSSRAGGIESVTVTHGGDVEQYTDEADIGAITALLRFGGQNVSAVPENEPDYLVEIDGERGVSELKVWCAGAEIVCEIDGEMAWIAKGTSEELAGLIG